MVDLSSHICFDDYVRVPCEPIVVSKELLRNKDHTREDYPDIELIVILE